MNRVIICKAVWFARMIFLILVGLAFAASWRFNASAQDQCGVVTSIAFPVDRSVFQLAQDFSSPSPRHQGRWTREHATARPSRTTWMNRASG